jgi:hypothetical protein
MLRLVSYAKENNVTLRSLGATAFKYHCPNYAYLFDKFGRQLSDLDLAGYSREAPKIEKLFEKLGYRKRLIQAFVSARERQIYYDPINNRKVDVFLDRLTMCHTIEFCDRLSVDFPTLPLAELLLEKMQIVQLTEKDVKDTLILLREHAVGDSDDETVNIRYIARLLAEDWGFYYTVITNLKKLVSMLNNYRIQLTDDGVNDIKYKVKTALEIIQNEPKSLKWKVREKVGTKVKWYKEVEPIEDR